MATFKGNPITLQGTQVQVGDKAPDFEVLATDLSKKTLASYEGVRILSVVPSIDTGSCDPQTPKFNERTNKAPDARPFASSLGWKLGAGTGRRANTTKK